MLLKSHDSQFESCKFHAPMSQIAIEIGKRRKPCDSWDDSQIVRVTFMNRKLVQFIWWERDERRGKNEEGARRRKKQRRRHTFFIITTLSSIFLRVSSCVRCCCSRCLRVSSLSFSSCFAYRVSVPPLLGFHCCFSFSFAFFSFSFYFTSGGSHSS